MTRGTDTGNRDTVQTTRTMLETVEVIKRLEGATVTEVAAELGYAKSTVYRHLSTLSDLGYVVKTDNEYRVGLRFLELGQHARTRQAGYDLTTKKVEEIAERTGERAQFIVREHGDAVYIHRAFGDDAVRTDPGIGSRIPLHATAAGKAILANLDEDELFDVLEQTDFEGFTDHTITDREELLDELAEIRERGYSFNREENLKGLHAVGVPILGDGGVVIGALSVSGPSHRLRGDRFHEDLPNLLLGTANELELNITHT
ncbi:DNA-binding transcriptional regulator, IclR family [Halopenitus malekzadehii]|uniref:DNA-binding transcriptional regulator, IclR family n=1 Tax=Halopenitus malekzadehii TaxID=1267564 RepID=A0A1H6IRC1_9EURY|nr:IclR family transcriptional regulator [Halopenitus malekzadehii]SEH50110.1 DNA-binding transcriptional regulator, IclR family [Halopenitus malekzadehii]